MIGDDEYQMILKADSSVIQNPKRRKYLLEKWFHKGWWKYKGFTDEFRRIRDLAVNRDRYMDSFDGRVVRITFLKKWTCPPTVGIPVHHGDNGWYFYTAGLNNWWLGDYRLDDVAYAELYPEPDKVWRRINYVWWKWNGHGDMFHHKIAEYSPGTVCDYSRAPEGVFSYSNPAGKVGECYPHCQCKFLKKTT